MSDCHFGVSPVNYPDPDPPLRCPHTLASPTIPYPPLPYPLLDCPPFHTLSSTPLPYAILPSHLLSIPIYFSSSCISSPPLPFLTPVPYSPLPYHLSCPINHFRPFIPSPDIPFPSQTLPSLPLSPTLG